MTSPTQAASLIVRGGKITTLDDNRPDATALAVRDGRFVHVGTDASVDRLRGPDTRVIDVAGRRVIPGLNDSHTHVIRGGLTYNLELRWDGVRSLGQALEMLRAQAERTPAPQWVRVIGGWSEFQFVERRMPTLAEINRAAPDTPVFILHLYARALLNRAALRALGYEQNPPSFDRGEVVRDDRGVPTGMLLARPSAMILYRTLARAPALGQADRINSTRQFMRELNRLGVTSAIDAGGGGQNYPDDYAIARTVRDNGWATVRLAYNLFAQRAGQEFDDFSQWVKMTGPGDGDAMFKANGAGENLVWSAADFENFLQPRPELNASMDGDLERVIRLFAEHRWPFRIHATYDESIQRFLSVFERVHRDTPLTGLHWLLDHAETISAASLHRVQELGGGIAIQHRMAFQGEYFIERYGRAAVARTPPVRQMLAMGIPVGAGTDATRVASYNPWIALYWLTTGKTVGGMTMYGDDNLLTREEALRLWTVGSAWVSSDEGEKGRIAEGQLADLAVLGQDYFAVADHDIKDLESVLTIVGGRVVYAGDDFASEAPAPLPVSPDWSPVGVYGGYQHQAQRRSSIATAASAPCAHEPGVLHETLIDRAKRWLDSPFGAGPGCACFAF